MQIGFLSEIKNRMVNSVDPDERFFTSRLIRIYTVCTGIFIACRTEGINETKRREETALLQKQNRQTITEPNTTDIPPRNGI